MSASGSYIIDRDKEFLKFLKSRYPLFHLSNIFFRDLHYGVMAFLENNDRQHGYTPTEGVTREVIGHFEQQNIFRRIDEKTWLLTYPEFKAVAPKKPAAAKPAAAAPGARPAAAPPKPASPKPATAPATATAAATPSAQSGAGDAPASAPQEKKEAKGEQPA